MWRSTAISPLRTMGELSAITSFIVALSLFILQLLFELGHSRNEKALLNLTVGGQILFAIEDVEKNGIEQVVVAALRIILDDDVF